MPHYICTGSCNEEHHSPGVCEAMYCTKEGQPLVPCSCEDGQHKSAGEKTDDELSGDFF